MPASKSLTVFHYNDVYNLESGSREPVGGAARFLSVVASRSSESPLVLFGGDALNPSMASTFFKGRQMIPALNLIGTRAACVGNHDLDFGLENLAACVRESDFPWLLANITLARDGEHLCGAVPTAVIHHDGVKVGIVGLAEEEWIDTLSAVSPEDLRYEDFVACGRRLATELRDDGCEVVLALTHMREPNDERLAREAPEFDAVLGGHDHHCVTRAVEPHGVPVLKAGTEFRWLVAATFAVPADGGRPVARWETIEVTSDIPEHPDMKRIADDVETKLGDSMDVQIGETCVPLEGRFLKVRTEETNLGNLVADILRDASGADACVLNGGTLRSDVIHPPGALTFRDLVAILPMLDETCVLEMTGAGIVEALENACSAYPALEGRFAQVSGLAYVFDAARPAGSRVVSVEIPRGTPLAPEKNTACARKRTSRSGRTGTIRSRRRGCARVARGGGVPARADGVSQPSRDPRRAQRAGRARGGCRGRGGGGGRVGSTRGVRIRAGERDGPLEGVGERRREAEGRRARGEQSPLAGKHPITGALCLAPRVDGRIVTLNPVENIGGRPRAASETCRTTETET